MTVEIFIGHGQGWGQWATAASAVIAVLALIVAMRERVARRANLRLGARNVHYFAWRMSDDLLSRAQWEPPRPKRQKPLRSEAELRAVEQGLDAVAHVDLEPLHLLQHGIELRYNWNLACAYSRGEAVTIEDIGYRLERGRLAIRAFDAALFRDGARFERDGALPSDSDANIAQPHDWQRWKRALARWLKIEKARPGEPERAKVPVCD